MKRATWLAEQPFTLLLGAGFFGFFSHTGLLLALEEAGLRPTRIVGVSAGALAGGLWASGLSASSIAEQLQALRREEFWDPGVPLGGLLRGRKFAAKLRTVLEPTGVRHVEHTKVPFGAVVHDVLARRTDVLRAGPLDLAIQASCTVPFMFRPIWSGGRLLVDGGVSDRSGFAGLVRGERVLFHYIPSRRPFSRERQAPMRVPEAEALMLVTPDVPPVHPFRLDAGPLALRHTEEHARRWLDGPLSP